VIYRKFFFFEDMRLLVKFVIYYPSPNPLRKVPKPQNIYGKLAVAKTFVVSQSMRNYTKTPNYFLNHHHSYNSAFPALNNKFNKLSCNLCFYNVDHLLLAVIILFELFMLYIYQKKYCYIGGQHEFCRCSII
jgi:hypothetical protein